MRVRNFGIGFVATVVAIGVTLPARASADTPTTLYVGTGVNCTDAGSGTSTAPFCTVTAALGAVVPGETISVSGVHNEAVVVNKSGTAAAPITFTGFGSLSGVGASLTFDGVHDVAWSNMSVAQGPSGIEIHNSSRITLKNLGVFVPATATVPAVSLIGATDSTLTTVHAVGPAGGIVLDAATSGVTVSGVSYSPPAGHLGVVGFDVFGHQNSIIDNGNLAGAGVVIRIEPGAADNVVASNLITANGSDAIDDNGAGTDIVNNTLLRVCDVGINIGAAATHSSVENNVVQAIRDCSTDGAPEHVGIGVFGAATATATVDYNTVTVTGTNLPYAWGTDCSSLAAFQQASGQGAHDNTGSAQTLPAYSAPTTDSANSAAPGYPSTDFYGHPRADNPIAANTGAGPTTYADRGAVEVQPSAPTPVMSYAPQTILTGDPSPSWQVTETVTVPGTWAPVTTMTATFGDGTPAQTVDATLDSSGVGSATFTHVYQGVGLWPITVTTVDSLGVTGSNWINTDLMGPQVVFTPSWSLTTTRRGRYARHGHRELRMGVDGHADLPVRLRRRDRLGFGGRFQRCHAHLSESRLVQRDHEGDRRRDHLHLRSVHRRRQQWSGAVHRDYAEFAFSTPATPRVWRLRRRWPAATR